MLCYLFSFVFASEILEAQQTFDDCVASYQKNETVPHCIRAFDPAQGRSDCEEQAVIMMDFLRKKKRYQDLLDSEKHYVRLRYLFSDKNVYDLFGMVISSIEKPELLRCAHSLDLRLQISQFVDRKMKEYAQELLPNHAKDPAFDLLPIGKYNIPRISTTGGIAILFAYAKKYNVPVMLRIKRMEIHAKYLKGQGEAFLPYVYDHAKGKFIYTKEINPHHPIFCIRAFAMTNGKEKSIAVPSFMPKRFHKMACLFNDLKQSKDFKTYSAYLKSIDIEKLMMLLAAREDHNNKRPMTRSSFLKEYPQVSAFFYDNEDYFEKGQYTKNPKTIAIRHVYVSTLSQQMKSAEERLKKIGKEKFEDILTS